MKLWYQHGSEHSANLVMIGHFENSYEATMAKEVIAALINQATEDQSNGTLTLGDSPARYRDAMFDLLLKLNISSIGPAELEQFAYDVSVKQDDKTLVLTTEELDVSAFLKVMFLKGARIEVYSAHHHPDSEHGRGRR